MTKTVLILGASGKIGSHAARAFSQAGWVVRQYRRGSDMDKAAIGADVIVNGLNPPNYHNWSDLIPQITAQVIAAAKASGATVILPGNVYNFGASGGEWSERTPHTPVSRKGRIRVDMEQSYRASGVQTIILRAGNFIDPDQNGDLMSRITLAKVAKGRVTLMGRPDVIQPYAYLPDWAQAAVGLADKRHDLGVFEDIPFAGHAFSMDELRDYLQSALGRRLRYVGFPWWAMAITAPVWELARELKEMRYLWDTPHSLDGTKLASVLPDFAPSAREVVMRAGLPPQVHPNKMMRTGGQSVAAK